MTGSIHIQLRNFAASNPHITRTETAASANTCTNAARMTFGHFRHQTGDRTTGTGNQVHDLPAFRFMLQRPLDGRHLPRKAPHTGKKPLFMSYVM